ncbi:protein phosphatase 2C domain-containing protein [Soonwooa sp.]|uniref:protein phosphatase 2C domain-containing protein n=1 Tax=Soonwooa sp. TaxID=1938592 RepID=UPI002629AA3B|nr:protein phosphatase 2C domain-containing protein [Soonwooa sp.]
MEKILNEILKENNIESSKVVNATISKLSENVKVNEISKSILDLKLQILQIFNMYKEKEEFIEAQLSIPNANVKKEYNFCFDTSIFPAIKITDVKNLDQVGLEFNPETVCISGIPTTANQIEIQIEFFSTNDENMEIDFKTIPFIVNADPKDLWLNKPSPQDEVFPKEDNVTFKSKFLDKKIVVASKRGRSHAHEGSFRDDDFVVKQLADHWSVVAVADGAGSAKLARAGSKFATENIVKSLEDEAFLLALSKEVENYFSAENNAETNVTSNIESSETENHLEENAIETEGKNSKLDSKRFIINSLYTRVKKLNADLDAFATSEGATLKDIHTTLIFTLLKKFEFGYVVLSFGVGDCPINILQNNDTEVKLLNFLDVGDFGGGTRFITMPEIFGKPDMVNRFGINCFKDFSKLFLMTDGIYDPKFVVESKLENMESWKNFLRDLNGENEDGIRVDFANDAEVDKQLSDWMDFWSKGNHDDRTLAIIY